MKIMYRSKYFNLGKVVVSYKVSKLLMDSKQFAREVDLSLRRFCLKDWGIISDEDKQINEDALQYLDNLYLLGAYQTSCGRIWIITNRATENPGDNVTTLLFPEER